MKLIEFKMDWADEFYAEGFQIYTDEAWNEIVEFNKANPNKRFSFWFGTNEGWDREPFSEFFDSCKVLDVTDEQIEVIATAFRLKNFSHNGGKVWYSSFGQFPDLWAMTDGEYEDGDEDE